MTSPSQRRPASGTKGLYGAAWKALLRVPVLALSLAAAHAGAHETPAVTAAMPARVTAGSTVPQMPAIATASPAWTGALVDLDARLLIETRALGADGVTRSTRYEEQLVRRGQQAWTRRVLPAHAHAAAAPKGPAHGKHRHLNPVEAGRLVSREAGGISFALVLAEEKTVVSVPAPEYANVGFDGSWERAYHLVSGADLTRMSRSSRPSPVPGAVWFERDTAEQRERLLWDVGLQIVRRIETVSRDGARSFSLQVDPRVSALPPAPWRASAAYEQRRYSDYLD